MQTPVMPKAGELAPAAKTGNGSKGEHPLDLSRIAQDLQIRKVQVESVVQLLDEGNTVPFITRYRKERTGGLNEEIIRQIQARDHPSPPARGTQADHSQEHRRPGQADRRAEKRHSCSRHPQAARRPVPTLQAQETDAGDHCAGTWSGAARPRHLEPRPRRAEPERGPAGYGQSGEGAQHSGRRPAGRATHPGRADFRHR